jgi:pectinesterase
MITRRMLAGLALTPLLASRASATDIQTLRVPEEFPTVGEALARLPVGGGVIEIQPGEYREKLIIPQPEVHLRGLGDAPGDVRIVWGDGAKTNPGLSNAATLWASGDGFRATNLTIQNDWSLNNAEPSQAPVLFLRADRAVLRNVRLLGAQDTLFAGSRSPETPCRQYFAECYVEGHVDFIFGNALAFFDRCHIHVIDQGTGFITAHSRTAEIETSAYVFDHCRITTAGAGEYYFGRAWRPYARVVFLDTTIDGRIDPTGWREWTPGQTRTFETASFAEFGSTGPGADMTNRVSWAKSLTASQAANWRLERVFPDADWLRDPAR